MWKITLSTPDKRNISNLLSGVLTTSGIFTNNINYSTYELPHICSTNAIYKFWFLTMNTQIQEGNVNMKMKFVSIKLSVQDCSMEICTEYILYNLLNIFKRITVNLVLLVEKLWCIFSRKQWAVKYFIEVYL